MSELKDWTDCSLWKVLESRTDDHAQECRTTLRRIMPKIQTVLVSGGTSPKDFTLHDAGHSSRVAERMLEVAGETIRTLTCFELSLLLLSAYLHDIGMTPEFNKVDAHFNYLLTAKEHLLTGEEIVELQAWLDDKGYQVNPPIPDTMPLADRLALAREITTYYCRHRHNDWSAEWIRAKLADEPLSNYCGWVEDMILLCQSHHFGFDRLTQQPFRPRRVGSPSEVVNLRFLALVLRMADILDFDPERTPEIILRHRSTSPGSQIYWWKDKEIALKLAYGKLVVTARPSSARIHRAIEETVDAIDAEMALCKRIADDYPIGAIPGEEELPYSWGLVAACHRDIEPREGSYEYIDGAFRPDTKKLLSLLSGTSLYRTRFHAVRELVQNAFDAVSERIAYLRLDQLDPASAKLANHLREQHRVSLQLETEGADAYLVCTDNGIGMTKTIIRDRVLVAGSSPRHDVRALDRRCRKAGFELGRSGQFGIGILSYFMIATNVEIETLRALEAGDSDSTKWHFETEGVGSFGELRRLGGSLPGTRVRLRLSNEISSNPAAWYEELREYIEKKLLFIPCEFYLSSPLPGCLPLALKPGWSTRDYSESTAEELRGAASSRETEGWDLLKSAEREKRLAKRNEIEGFEKEVKSCLLWRTEEGILSDGSAEFQIHLPYFQLQREASLAFLHAETEESGRLVLHHFLNGMCFRPEGTLEEAWKGMAIESTPEPVWEEPKLPIPSGSFVRINWVSSKAGEIMASRDEMVGNDYAVARDEIREHWEKMLSGFLKEFKDSRFAWLNEQVALGIPCHASRCSWVREDGQGERGGQEAFYWGEPKFPAVSRSSFGYFLGKEERQLEIDGKSVEIIPLLAFVSEYPHQDHSGLGWSSELLPPDRVVLLERSSTSMAPIWLRPPKPTAMSRLLESKFPPGWRNLCGARFDWYAGQTGPAVVWNCANPLVKQIVPSAWKWCSETFRESIDPLPHRDELLADRSKAASWLLQCAAQDSRGVWEGLPERNSGFLPELLSSLFPSKVPVERRQVLFWIEPAGGDSRLCVLTTLQWEVLRGDAVKKYLPIPQAPWRISTLGRKKNQKQ